MSRFYKAVKLTLKILGVILLLIGLYGAWLIRADYGDLPLILLPVASFVLAFALSGEMRGAVKERGAVIGQPGRELETLGDATALRQTILTQLNACQAAEEASHRSMCEISTANTQAIHGMLTQWIRTDFIEAQQAEIEAVEKISCQQHSDWFLLAEKATESDTSLQSTGEALSSAKETYDKVGGVIKNLLANEEKKVRNLEAKAKYERLRLDVAALVEARKEIDAKINSQREAFLQNCCENIEQLPDSTPLGNKIRVVVGDTTKKIAEEWGRHCQEQRQAQEAIGRDMARLTALYSTQVGATNLGVL